MRLTSRSWAARSPQPKYHQPFDAIFAGRWLGEAEAVVVGQSSNKKLWLGQLVRVGNSAGDGQRSCRCLFAPPTRPKTPRAAKNRRLSQKGSNSCERPSCEPDRSPTNDLHRVQAVTQTTNLRSVPSSWPVISQQPAAGIPIPTTMNEPMSSRAP